MEASLARFVQRVIGQLEQLGRVRTAVGCIGLSFDGFCRLSPEAFAHIHAAYAGMREEQCRGEWERTRILATICAQPYSKKRLTPHTLLPLPWDAEGTRKRTPRAAVLSKDEALQRFERRLRCELPHGHGVVASLNGARHGGKKAYQRGNVCDNSSP